MSKFVVTRQAYFGVDPEDRYCVEIAEGGLNYANADAFSAKYPGEFEEYTDPREAVQVAISIAEQWAADYPDMKINIGEGYTMGMTMPFEGQEKEDLIAWAEKRYSEMEKCPTCGQIMEGAKEWYQAGEWYSGEMVPNDDGEKFCSEHCAEKASWYHCQGDCDNAYTWEDRRKLSETHAGILCPVCRLIPCGVCGIIHEDHDGVEYLPCSDCGGEGCIKCGYSGETDKHEFEAPDWVMSPAEVQVWDNHGEFDRITPDGLYIDETFDRFTAVYPDQSYVGMSERPFHPMGVGQHGEAVGYKIYSPETWEDPSGNTVSHLGRKIELDDLPDDCIKLVMQDLMGYVKAREEREDKS